MLKVRRFYIISQQPSAGSKAQPPPKKRRVPSAASTKSSEDGPARKRGRPKKADQGEKNEKNGDGPEEKKERAKRKKHRIHYGIEPMSTSELVLEALSSLPDENGGVSVSAIKNHVLLNGDLAPGRLKYFLKTALKKLVEQGRNVDRKKTFQFSLITVLAPIINTHNTFKFFSVLLGE